MTGWTCYCGADNGSDRSSCGNCGRGKRSGPPRYCSTPEEAFAAGWDEPCEHGVPDITDCPGCRLSDEDIRRVAVLLGGLRESLPESASAAESLAA